VGTRLRQRGEGHVADLGGGSDESDNGVLAGAARTELAIADGQGAPPAAARHTRQAAHKSGETSSSDTLTLADRSICVAGKIGCH